MTLIIVAAAFGLVGVALLVAAAVGARRTQQLRQSGARSRATVRELKTRELKIRSSGDPVSDDTVYAPVLEFATPDGRVHRIEGDASYPPKYAVGDEVSVIFDPADPGAAKVETFIGLWLGVLLAGIGGAIACGVALLLLVLE